MADSSPVPEPPDTLTDTRELLLGYLDFYRAALVRKLDGMPDDDLRTSRLPSGWTPLGLLKHLVYVERRWFRWGFAAERVDDVDGDRDPDSGRWYVRPEESADELKRLFLDECARSREIVGGADLQDRASAGGGFGPSEHRPVLEWILFHVLQEYARHLGHLDIVRELADGATGE